MKTVRTNGNANAPTYGANMLTSDSPNTTKGGLNIDSAGQPEIWNAAGQAIYDMSSTGQPQIKNAAGTVMLDLSSSLARVPVVIKLVVPVQVALTGVLAGGSIANPFGYEVIVTNAVLRITTVSTGASTMDIGVAADATTSNDTLMDGVSGAVLGAYDNVKNAGTNGRSGVIWGTSQFINIAEASGDVAGIIADLYLTCYRS